MRIGTVESFVVVDVIAEMVERGELSGRQAERRLTDEVGEDNYAAIDELRRRVLEIRASREVVSVNVP